MFRVLIISLFVGQVAQAEETTENLATDRIQQVSVVSFFGTTGGLN